MGKWCICQRRRFGEIMKKLEAKDLRIGNLVYGVAGNKKIVAEVTDLDNVNLTEYPIWLASKDGDGEDEYESIEPIPLTEEWLLKLGFEYDEFSDEDNPFLDLRYNRFLFQSDKSVNYNTVYLTINKTDIKIKYVHELQNIFYCLTGNELEIKHI